MKNLKRGSSVITKETVVLPVYDITRKTNSGVNSGGTKEILKGKKIEILARMKSTNGNSILKTNYGTFDANVLENLK